MKRLSSSLYLNNLRLVKKARSNNRIRINNIRKRGGSLLLALGLLRLLAETTKNIAKGVLHVRLLSL